MSSAPRKPAPRAPKPVGRYWAGKAPKGARDIDSDDDEEDDAPAQDLDQPDIALAGEQDIVPADDDEDELVAAPAAYKPAKPMNLTLKDVNISREGKVIVAGRQESGRTLEEQGVLSSLTLPSSHFTRTRV
jgi:microfibrillar-associated protein 1